MSGNVWIAPLVVLVLGTLAGLRIAMVLRRRARDAEARAAADLDLEITDLEARRDDLYQRLRQADTDGIDDHDRSALELAAARALRDLDQARSRMPTESATSADDRSEPPRRARSGLAGFAYGFGAASLIGLLVYWVVRDAQPGERGAPMPRGAEAAPRPDNALPPMVAAQVQALEEKLAADPSDVASRRELAVTLLAAQQYVPAFQHAAELLGALPDDPDGLFVQGVVHLAMGRNDTAIGQLDRVLQQHPEHTYAWLYKGIGLFQQGGKDDAIAAWEEGLRKAGGRHPDLEGLIAQARNTPAGGLPGSASGAPSAAPTRPADGAALAWQAPDGWESQPPSSGMRHAQYRVPGPAGDAECVVFYFGAGQGGDGMANARRWANQFEQPDGSSSEEAMATGQTQVGDIPVLTVEVTGTYTGGMSGGPPMPEAMLLGAVARGPDANWFFKLTGPQGTVEAQRGAFEGLIGSLRAASGDG